LEYVTIVDANEIPVWASYPPPQLNFNQFQHRVRALGPRSRAARRKAATGLEIADPAMRDGAPGNSLPNTSDPSLRDSALARPGQDI